MKPALSSLFCCLLSLSAFNSCATAGIADTPRDSGRGSSAETIDVRVDTRVELAAVMARLAGFEEYQTTGIPAYDQAVDAHFGRFRGHASISLMKKLREERGIAYNAPLEMALAAAPRTWQPMVQFAPWPSFLDSRWDAASASAFLAAAAAFERDTHARDFFATQAPLHAEAAAAVRKNLAQRLDTAWFRSRMPPRGITGFVVIPGLLAGNNSYGPHLRYADGREIVFGILATPTHRVGQSIAYPADAQLSLLVHEFHHSYMNAWADEHMTTLLPAADALFRAVQPRMEELAYGEPRILLYESLVRAQTQRYMRHRGETEVLRRLVAEDQSKGFPWVPALADLFDEIEATGRVAYDDDTAKRVAGLLAQWGWDDGAKIVAEQQRIAAQQAARLATGPQIVEFAPAQDAVVDADLAILEIRFDRPMAPGLAIFGDVPEVAGKPSWDESRQVLRLPVRVQAGAHYHLYLNKEDTLKMMSADGEPLVPREWRFRVRAADN